jgi:hypothetical protein
LQDPTKFTQIGILGLKIYHLATLDLILPFFARQLHLTRLLTTSAKTLPLFCRATLTRLWKAINRQIQVRHQPDNPTNGANVMIIQVIFCRKWKF